MQALELVTTIDKSTGRVHERVLVVKSGIGPDGQPFESRRRMVDERCNLDDAGDYEVFTRGGPTDRGDGVPSDADPASVCKFCFPVTLAF